MTEDNCQTQLIEIVVIAFFGHFLRMFLGEKYYEILILGIVSQGGLFSYQKNLPHLIDLTKGMVSKTLGKMESDGLVRVSDDEIDKREKVLSLTKKGAYTLHWVYGELKLYDNQMNAGIPENDSEKFVSGLVKRMDNLLSNPGSISEDIPPYDNSHEEKSYPIPRLVSPEEQQRLIEMMSRISEENKTLKKRKF